MAHVEGGPAEVRVDEDVVDNERRGRGTRGMPHVVWRKLKSPGVPVHTK